MVIGETDARTPGQGRLAAGDRVVLKATIA